MESPWLWPQAAYGVIRSIRNAGLAFLAGTSLAMAEPVTVAALGDSLTQGFGLPPDAGFVPVLDAWLAGAGEDVILINAGVSGDTTAGGLSRAAWTLTPEVDALIVALGGNDLLRGIEPAVSRANLDGIMAAAAEAGVPVLLVGLDAPSNYGASYEAEFEAIFPDLAAEYDALLYPSFLAPLTEDADLATALARYMQADGIHPNAAGVERIVAGIGPVVRDLVARTRDAGTD